MIRAKVSKGYGAGFTDSGLHAFKPPLLQTTTAWFASDAAGRDATEYVNMQSVNIVVRKSY